MEKILIFIHGFLGQASDWKSVLGHLDLQITSHCIDLHRDLKEDDLSFATWPRAFEKWLQKKSVKKPFILIGYSLGGRLILPLLEKGLSHQAVLLSPHIGLPVSAVTDRRQRDHVNQDWARRFLNDPWHQVIREWNEQEVFKGSRREVPRMESEISREKLAAQLVGFSLGQQKDYSFLFENPQFQGLYLAGENDLWYSELALKLQGRYAGLDVKLMRDSGHRLLFDQPSAVAREISDFVRRLKLVSFT